MTFHIVVWGDSIAGGVKDCEVGGWVNRLQMHFMNAPVYKSVQNCGISGTTTSSLLERFKIEAEARKPNIILFEVGKNDSTKEYSVSQKDFEDNLNKLIKEAKVFSSKLIFLGIPGVDESKTTPFPKGVRPYYYNNQIKEYAQIIQKFCKQNNLTFISLQGLLDTKKDLYDGLHPNAQGHKKIFKKVLPVVEKIIEEIGKT